MPTLLVNARMSPELAERVANSVAGRRGAAASRGRARAVRLLFRVVIAAILLTTFALAFGSYRTRARARAAEEASIETRRARLLAAVHAQAVGTADAQLVPRLEQRLGQLAAANEPDLVADALRTTGLDAVLRRPILYVRGPVASFADPAKVAAAAAMSVKDGLVVCLLAPPESRAENVVLARAKRAYGRHLALEDATTNVRRLHDLEGGMPFLLAPFERRIIAAPTAVELVALESAFDKAPIVDAKRAARSELLLAAFDEPGDGSGPTEIDGERPHDVRVVLVELASGATLLRLRRHVDPGWASSSARIQYASGIDACALAYDVRDAVTKR